VTEVKPPDVQRSNMTLCWSRPRQCEIVTTLSCRSCGWLGSENPAPDLFAPAEHTDQECRRRQLDPDYRHDQDAAWRTAAGLSPGHQQ
jgi:hypothetical protein